MVDGRRARWVAHFIGVLLVGALAGCGGGDTGGGLQVASIEDFTDPDAHEQRAGDGDGDGLLDSIEITPRTIVIDTSGFGLGTSEHELLERREVTSDADKEDTDGDGLSDYEEYILRTDPRSADTDGDGLSDYDEWNKWWSSPVTVDSDGDATGPDNNLPPNQLLFDGMELVGTGKGSTSPTLDDTDGDGKTDFEEIDHAFRSPLIAELPKAKIELMGAPRIDLFVEYAEEEAEEQNFSSVLTSSTEESTSSSNSSTSEIHNKIGVEVSIQSETKAGGGFGGLPTGALTVGAKASFEHEWVSANTQTYTTESVRGTQEEAGRYWGTSNTFTETASSGEIRLDMRIRNLSQSSAFRVSQLGVAVRMWSPGPLPEEGSYQTLAVLVPEGFENFTLAPGGVTGVFPVSATGLNPKLVKEFLTFPERLIFETIYFDLENQEGINFNFLTENAYAQTASISIDNGIDEPEVVRVATNVRRSDPDENGDGGARYIGVGLKQVLEEILGKRVQTTTRDVEFEGISRRVSVLEKFEDEGAFAELEPPAYEGSVSLNHGSSIITLVGVDGIDDLAAYLARDGSDENPAWWEEWLGRTLELDVQAADGVATRKNRGYVIVQAEASDLGVGQLRLDRTVVLEPDVQGGPVDVPFLLNNLFQGNPHVLEDSPTTPAPVEAGSKQSFWFILGTEQMVEEGRLKPHTNFEDIVLKAGDQIQMTFWSDEDGDCLSTLLEGGQGTNEVAGDGACDPLDCDGDGLGNSVESIRGWMAGAPAVLPAERVRFLEVLADLRAGVPVPAPGTPPDQVVYLESLKAKIVLDDPVRGYPKWVRSNPRTSNGDGDGLTDFFECVHGTDPNATDTDGDGLRDGADPDPLVAARVLHVNRGWERPLDADGMPIDIAVTDPARGLSWETAFVHLQDALAAARIRNADTEGGDLITANDVGQIWVAGGTYRADEGTDASAGLGSFDLIDGVAIVGGFSGTELLRSQRSGEESVLLSSPTAPPGAAVVFAAADLSRTAVLDSFVVMDAEPTANPAGPGLLNAGAPSILNIVFHGHRVDDLDLGDSDYLNPAGAAVLDRGSAGAETHALYEGCVFSSNHHFLFGGAMFFLHAAAEVVDCRFENNSATRWGGAVYGMDCSATRFERCLFANNASVHGGAVTLYQSGARFQDCTFVGNSTSPTSEPAFRFAHHSWVVGVTATAVGQVDDVLFPDGDESTPYHEQRIGDSEDGYEGVGGMVKPGGSVTFKPGPIEAIGSKEGRGVPAWEAPLSYIVGFENRVLHSTGGQRRSGGAIYCFGASHLALVQCVFHRNQASAGGALACYDDAHCDILGCTFAKNESIGLGAAIFAPDEETTGLMVNCIAAGEAAAVVRAPPVPEIYSVLQNGDRTRKGGDPHKLYNLFYYDDNEAAGADGFYPGGDLKKDLDPVKYHTDGWVSLREWEYRDPVIPTQLYIENPNFRLQSNLVLTTPTIEGEPDLGFGGYVGNIVGGNGSGGRISLVDIRFPDRLQPTEACEAIDRGQVSGIDYDPFTPGTQPAPALDISGQKRSQGGGIDIGAYEYASDAK